MDGKQQEAFDLCLNGHNVLITGQAGTGKTVLLTKICRALQRNGKNVQVTSTTGIASTCFPKDLNASTVHRWSGLDDGRYEAEDTAQLIKSSPKFYPTLTRICNTNVLIVDEISMLSKKMFEQLEHICSSVRQSKAYFGGLQVIFSGDFYQLPPVPNKEYNDNGELCFESSIFKSAVPHKVVLSKILRQENEELAKVINETARGHLTEFSQRFLKSLYRPITDTSSVKLFSNNLLVDTFNRAQLFDAVGDIVEYKSVDGGERRHLGNVSAQPTLWLKKGSPVILLRNISNVLVNGLTGTVKEFEPDGPVVEFPTVGITSTIKRTEFSVYSPKMRRNLATRLQIPLKLAYALTIHKAQGMTLESVEIDCSQIFKPGQLGVAIGRVRTTDGLRIKNFHPRYCLPQPVSIDMFLQDPSKDPVHDTSCCKHDRYIQPDEIEFTIDADYEPYDLDACEEEFDEEFNEVLKTLDTEAPVVPNIPEGFSVTSTLESMKPTQPLLTPKQKEVNEIICGLTPSSMNELQKFCEKEFTALNSIIDEMNITAPVAVKPETITKFIEKCHQHQISAQYRLNCMLCFPDRNISGAHWYITYKLTIAIRQFLLSQKEKIFPSAEREISKREVTTASKTRIRYVGGYCIHKIKEEQVSVVKNHMYSRSVEAQERYQKACDILELVNSFREEEEHLKANTVDPDSLMDTVRKQYVNKGLTHISDELYHFFVKLCEASLSLLVDKNLNEKAEDLFDHCLSEIQNSTPLTELFMHACSAKRAESSTKSHLLPEDESKEIEGVMNSMLKTITVREEVFKMISRKFLFVMLVQFRSDLLQAFEVARTMSHRKQIQVKKKKLEESLKSLSFKTIAEDNTEHKQMSHSLLQGMLLRKAAVLEPMTKQQLLLLCKAYNIPATAKLKKQEMIDILGKGVIESQSMPNAEVLQSQTCTSEPVPSTSAQSVAEPVAGTSTIESTIETDEELCKICHKKGRAGVQWIQCDSCNLWLHRNCAGLRAKTKWDRFQQEGVQFMCKECI